MTISGCYLLLQKYWTKTPVSLPRYWSLAVQSLDCHLPSYPLILLLSWVTKFGWLFWARVDPKVDYHKVLILTFLFFFGFWGFRTIFPCWFFLFSFLDRFSCVDLRSDGCCWGGMRSVGLRRRAVNCSKNIVLNFIVGCKIIPSRVSSQHSRSLVFLSF